MAQANDYSVYIMSNPRRTVLYIGVTNDLERRVAEHKSHAYKGFTDQYNATDLVYHETCGRIDDAIAREKQLKGWTRRKKEALVERLNPDWRDLSTSPSRGPVVGRFAPSPTGRMHAGNVFAALVAWLVAKSQGGRIVLRIEDLDAERSKPQFVDAVQRDFERLGLTWDEGPFFQHDRQEAYRAAFDSLVERDLVYPCFCTRADLHAASAPHRGEKPVYPGTCRTLTSAERAARALERTPAQRLVVPDADVSFIDQVQGPYSQNLARDCGDFLVRRSDGAFAYQLAVVVDDAAQGVNSIVRGVDLLCSTPQQIHLQELLGLPHPDYAHIPLLVAELNRRLSKRDKDAALDELIARFKTPEAVIGHIAGITGLAPTSEPATPEELLRTFDLAALPATFPDLVQVQWR
ncbi:tRNA glutamyl-Q(34) synthetase GluQRS [Arabiibacter massiliensis]|uniref:tRNA glutamyl-Q(34) synthetase GluQRS n=1 Tax=Arabiibacter massiliensis TaxID=1870985 RepID=UPI0018D75E8C|nr:tRNA glutamyl-Q(34) synthetase GluQRS [Arabiibacter massiliensis]